MFSTLYKWVNNNRSYFILMLLGAGVSFFKQFVFAKYLGPDGFGNYAFVILIQSYAIYLCTLGLNEGLVRELTLLRANKRNVEADKLRNQVITAVTSITMIFGVLYTMVVYIISSEDTMFLYTILLVVPYALTNILVTLSLVDLRAKKLNIEFSYALFYRNILMLIVGIIFCSQGYSYTSVLIGEIFVSFCVFLFVANVWLKPFSWNYKFDKNLLNVARIGMPFNLSSLLRNLNTSIDRWFIASILSITALGQYSFAFIIFSGGLVITTIVGTVLEPSLIYQFANGESKKNILKKGIVTSVLLCSVLLVLAIPVLYLLEIMVPAFFPEFVEVQNLFPVIYFSTILVVMNVFDHVILVFGKGKKLMAAYLLNSVIFTVLCILISILKLPLVTFAYAFFVTRFINLVMSFSIAYHLSNLSSDKLE